MIKKESITWTRTGVYLCTKCSNEISAEFNQLKEIGNCAENLKNFLKAELKSRGLSKDIRVLTSSCLSVCKEGAQAIVIYKAGQEKPEAYTLHPEADRTELLNLILDV